MFCVATIRPGEQGRFYRIPTERDLRAAAGAAKELERRKAEHKGPLSLVPDERLDLRGIRHTWAMIYGLESWGDYFTPRQLLSLTTFVSLARKAAQKESADGMSAAVQTILGLAISRWSDICNSLCRWESTKTQVRNLFGRQAVPMIWDFAEAQIFSDAAGNYVVTLETMLEFIQRQAVISTVGVAQQASAATHPLPADCADAFVTDPPYYDAVPYAYLSDFFYVWLRRSVGHIHSDLFKEAAVPKDAEIVVDRMHELSNSTHDIAFYERELTKAFSEGRRITKPDAIGTVVFASKTTASWEAILKAVVDAGWIITGSWPIDTELENRVSAQGQARLASSVHLVCRPRENLDGSVRTDEIGDWRDVLQELPRRIHEWMPRLAEEGVVGADAIFACLGPALEIFSRYSRVEKASGEQVSLREYLEYVWAAVSKEALSMVFTGADATGFEEDARLTAMWLWTLNPGTNDNSEEGNSTDDEGDDDEGEAKPKKAKGGFVLEYDAARKIAQGLGAHLEDLRNLVEISGESARLLPVAERTVFLFGKDQGSAPMAPKGRKKDDQLKLGLFEELTAAETAEVAWGEKTVVRAGDTVLDRVHQSMILFAAGRGEALRRFLVEDGAGRDQRFWRLAQALAALYPKNTDERRWVEGVLARKKGLGL
jgi:adenine-specific DNA methylase